jgi:lipopolysaccharide biosynthesis glycosyltransferase
MMHIVMSIDSTFAPWAATTIRSLLDQHPSTDITVHILGDDTLAGADRDRLRATVDGTRTIVDFPAVDDSRIAHLPPIGRSGRVIWWRLLLPELFDDLDRVLFLDADVFVVRPMDDLWNTDLAGNSIAAVANVVDPGLFEHLRSIGVHDARKYFNAGVVLFDLARMRIDGSVQRLIATSEDLRGRTRWPDQDALNVVFQDGWFALHPRFNAMNSLWTWRAWADDLFGAGEAEEARREPAILHFEGPSLNKPWHYLNSHPRRRSYLAALARTPWAGVPMQERTLVTRALKLVPPPWRTGAYVQTKRLIRKIRSR